MKLAEALAERADIQKRLADLKDRAMRVARVQEGDAPDEDPQELIAEAERLHARLQELVTRVNRTNAQTAFGAGLDQGLEQGLEQGGETITDAIAERDLAARRRSFYADLATAASVRQDRFSRSEVKFVATVDVAALRAQADAAAKRYRELDTRLQQLNWSTDLL